MLTRQPPPPDFEWTAESIRALRSHLGQSQAALARELGIRQQTVSEWETGMYKPRGASITILTLLAVSSDFNFNLPPAKATPKERGRQTSNSSSGSNGNSSSRQSAVSAPREMRGPRTHPDWIRTTASTGGAMSTRNSVQPGQSSIQLPGFKDGEIPM